MRRVGFRSGSAKRAGGVVVMKDCNRAKVPARVNSQWAHGDPDT